MNPTDPRVSAQNAPDYPADVPVDGPLDVGLPPPAVDVGVPVTTSLAGKNAQQAMGAVFRVIDLEHNSGGTGFLHKSGKIITAAHVVANASKEKLVVLGLRGVKVGVSEVAIDPYRDLAILTPTAPVPGPALELSSKPTVRVGLQIATWGFPAGYNGLAPMLTVGYLSAVDRASYRPGFIIPVYDVNVDFNSGNSGGPVLDLEDGSVLGVVSKKVAPAPPHILKALEDLKAQKEGTKYKVKPLNGQEVELTEAQVIGEVLTYLRSQTQLGIGQAVPTPQIRTFLLDQKIEP